MMRQITSILPISLATLLSACSPARNAGDGKIELPNVKEVTVTDGFWSPRFDQWRTVTANDVFDKFESKSVEDENERLARDTFRNFDLVAEGKRDIHHHAGFPWFDGLVYESVRGVADLLANHPDAALESRIDAYIDRIAAAQASEEDGYINTYTQLMESGHRWGQNGGFLRWQHDVYNAGMLVEAGIHYYNATGKTKLLEVATRFANMMCELIGPEPKQNIVPAHSGTEEPMIKLYRLYRDEPGLKDKVSVEVDENDYLELAKFFIEDRGNHCGFPLWAEWGNEASEKWIRENKYADPKFGPHSRPSFGDYAQDSISIFEYETIEGHAVRATLLATAVATMAKENDSPEYRATSERLWDNMVGRRYFVTGGVGAVHFDEKFGEDYFLPTDAYLETCAAVGAGFFSQRMNELTGDAKYMDELERSLYNNVLTGISLSGDHYTYQNPLNADHHGRWEWHECPCCPPMFLKIMSAVPSFIYSYDNDAVYVNLFIGSETTVNVGGKNVTISQETGYPWKGDVRVAVSPEKASVFTVKVRIPGWAMGKENPYDLYINDMKADVTLKVNGEELPLDVKNGYAEISRKWSAGDEIELSLPMRPRLVVANDNVETLKGMVALASGPLVYGIEECDNAGLAGLKIRKGGSMSIDFENSLLGGVNRMTGEAVDADGKAVRFSAVPYYAIGNRNPGEAYRVWIPAE